MTKEFDRSHLQEICAICGATRGMHRHTLYNCPAKGAAETNREHNNYAETKFTRIAPTTEQTELWKEMLQHAYDNDKIIYSQIDLDNIILNLSDKYSITRKQEVSGDDSITLTHAEIIKIMSEWGLLCMKSKPPDYYNDVAEFYSDKIITKSSRKQEVPEAVEFAEWCVENLQSMFDKDHKFKFWIKNSGIHEKDISTAEAYKEFQQFKNPTNAPAQTH